MPTEQANSKYTNAIRGELLTGVYGIGKPQYEMAVFKRFGLQFSQFVNWFRIMGREEPLPLGAVSNTTDGDYFAYEENKLLRAIKVTTPITGGGAAGTDLQFKLHADNFDSLNNFPLQLQDVLLTKNEVPAMVVDLSGSGSSITVTLRPINVSDTITQPSDNDELIKLTNAWAAGTGQPAGSSVGQTKQQFYWQIFKKTVQWEGSELVRQNWFETFDEKGTKVGMTNYDIARTELELNREIANAFLLGKATTNTNLKQTTVRGNENLVKLTEGIIPKIKRLGNTTQITSGNFDISDLDDAIAYAISQGVNTNYLLWAVGRTLRRDIREALKDYNDAGGGADYRELANVFNFEMNDEYMKQYVLNMGFKAINLDGTVCVFNTVEDWSNPDGLGHSSYGFDKHGIVIPLSTIKQPTGALEKNICIKYAQKDGYSRRMEVWTSGASGGDTRSYVGDIDEKNVYMRAHQMLVALGVNQWQYIHA